MDNGTIANICFNAATFALLVMIIKSLQKSIDKLFDLVVTKEMCSVHRESMEKDINNIGKIVREK